jgi:hypothetical protein
MNKTRRKAVNAVRIRLEELRAELDAIAEQEGEAFDAMSTGLQESAKGQTALTFADTLDSALSSIDSAIADLELAGAEPTDTKSVDA